MISLPNLLARACRVEPEKIAVRFAGRDTSWIDLEQHVTRLAAGLKGVGLQEGDRVALLSLNSDRYYEAMFAIPWAGGVMVPLNTRWALPEIQYAVEDSRSKALLFDDNFIDQADWLRQHQPGVEHFVYMGAGVCPAWARAYSTLIDEYEPVENPDSSGDDMAGIFYTGGTTGFPKGVMQSHRALWASAIGAMPDMYLTPESVYLHCAPMFHMADIAGSMGATLGCSQHVMMSKFDPGLLLAAIEQYQVTHMLLVPAMIKMVLNQPDLAKYDVSSLQRLMYGASPMPAEVLKQCLSVWPHVGLVQAYGQTEVAPIATTLSVQDHLAGGEKLKSAGRPSYVSEIKTVDEHGNECGLGQVGEIAVKGPHTMIGYWNKPEETARILKNGWVHTGDAGYFNEQGYLFIADRVKDMIISGGENIYTTEVENALISHPAVQDVAVIGIPDDKWGEAVHAIVVLKSEVSATAEEMVEHCRGQISSYKIPKSVTFRSEPLPLSGAGKVLKTELRKPFWEGRERQVN